MEVSSSSSLELSVATVPTAAAPPLTTLTAVEPTEEELINFNSLNSILNYLKDLSKRKGFNLYLAEESSTLTSSSNNNDADIKTTTTTSINKYKCSSINKLNSNLDCPASILVLKSIYSDESVDNEEEEEEEEEEEPEEGVTYNLKTNELGEEFHNHLLLDLTSAPSNNNNSSNNTTSNQIQDQNKLLVPAVDAVEMESVNEKGKRKDKDIEIVVIDDDEEEEDEEEIDELDPDEDEEGGMTIFSLKHKQPSISKATSVSSASSVGSYSGGRPSKLDRLKFMSNTVNLRVLVRSRAAEETYILPSLSNNFTSPTHQEFYLHALIAAYQRQFVFRLLNSGTTNANPIFALQCHGSTLTLLGTDGLSIPSLKRRGNNGIKSSCSFKLKIRKIEGTNGGWKVVNEVGEHNHSIELVTEKVKEKEKSEKVLAEERGKELTLVQKGKQKEVVNQESSSNLAVASTSTWAVASPAPVPLLPKINAAPSAIMTQSSQSFQSTSNYKSIFAPKGNMNYQSTPTPTPTLIPTWAPPPPAAIKATHMHPQSQFTNIPTMSKPFLTSSQSNRLLPIPLTSPSPSVAVGKLTGLVANGHPSTSANPSTSTSTSTPISIPSSKLNSNDSRTSKVASPYPNKIADPVNIQALVTTPSILPTVASTSIPSIARIGKGSGYLHQFLSPTPPPLTPPLTVLTHYHSLQVLTKESLLVAGLNSNCYPDSNLNSKKNPSNSNSSSTTSTSITGANPVSNANGFTVTNTQIPNHHQILPPPPPPPLPPIAPIIPPPSISPSISNTIPEVVIQPHASKLITTITTQEEDQEEDDEEEEVVVGAGKRRKGLSLSKINATLESEEPEFEFGNLDLTSINGELEVDRAVEKEVEILEEVQVGTNVNGNENGTVNGSERKRKRLRKISRSGGGVGDNNERGKYGEAFILVEVINKKGRKKLKLESEATEGERLNLMDLDINIKDSNTTTTTKPAASSTTPLVTLLPPTLATTSTSQLLPPVLSSSSPSVPLINHHIFHPPPLLSKIQQIQQQQQQQQRERERISACNARTNPPPPQLDTLNAASKLRAMEPEVATIPQGNFSRFTGLPLVGSTKLSMHESLDAREREERTRDEERRIMDEKLENGRRKRQELDNLSVNESSVISGIGNSFSTVRDREVSEVEKVVVLVQEQKKVKTKKKKKTKFIEVPVLIFETFIGKKEMKKKKREALAKEEEVEDEEVLLSVKSKGAGKVVERSGSPPFKRNKTPEYLPSDQISSPALPLYSTSTSTISSTFNATAIISALRKGTTLELFGKPTTTLETISTTPLAASIQRCSSQRRSESIHLVNGAVSNTSNARDRSRQSSAVLHDINLARPPLLPPLPASASSTRIGFSKSPSTHSASSTPYSSSQFNLLNTLSSSSAIRSRGNYSQSEDLQPLLNNHVSTDNQSLSQEQLESFLYTLNPSFVTYSNLIYKIGQVNSKERLINLIGMDRFRLEKFLVGLSNLASINTGAGAGFGGGSGSVGGEGIPVVQRIMLVGKLGEWKKAALI